MAEPVKVGATEVVRKTLEDSLNRALAREADATIALRQAKAEVRRIRVELGRQG